MPDTYFDAMDNINRVLWTISTAIQCSGECKRSAVYAGAAVSPFASLFDNFWSSRNYMRLAHVSCHTYVYMFAIIFSSLFSNIVQIVNGNNENSHTIESALSEAYGVRIQLFNY